MPREIAVVVQVDARGRVSVGEIPADRRSGLEPARDVRDGLAMAERLLSGADDIERRGFDDGFESIRPPDGDDPRARRGYDE